LKRFERALHLCKVFGTPNIRIFSYYPPDDGKVDWKQHRSAILERLKRKVAMAEKAGVCLLHENEHRIYGEDPDLVLDLFRSIDSPSFKAAYDPANYVHGGFDPWKGWQMTKQWTVHFHIKDWKHGEHKGVLAGAGQGRIPDVLREAHQAGYQGFATLEPHLLGGGPTGGVTGPELFPKAIAALKSILDSIGAFHA
jgi:sugar phosphate isomerase/epimerase